MRRRYHSVFGTYGISVFAVRDATLDELAQQPPLVRFEEPSLIGRAHRACNTPEGAAKKGTIASPWARAGA